MRVSWRITSSLEWIDEDPSLLSKIRNGERLFSANDQLVHVDLPDLLETETGEHRRHEVVDHLDSNQMDAPSFGQLDGNLGAERGQSLIAVTLSDGLNDEYSTKF